MNTYSFHVVFTTYSMLPSTWFDESFYTVEEAKAKAKQLVSINRNVWYIAIYPKGCSEVIVVNNPRH